MFSKIYISITSFLSIVLLACLSSYAQEIEVCKTCEFSTLTEAIAKAEPGAKIVVKKGVYQENTIIVDKPVSIIGEDLPTIDGQNKGDIFQVFADSVTIDGLKLINVGTSYTSDFAAIRVSRAEHFLIQNLELRKIFFGIYLENLIMERSEIIEFSVMPLMSIILVMGFIFGILKISKSRITPSRKCVMEFI